MGGVGAAAVVAWHEKVAWESDRTTWQNRWSWWMAQSLASGDSTCTGDPMLRASRSASACVSALVDPT
ncbi:MAG: hypothetical protein OXU69_14650 [Gemmatimonadota bacterium]|nr:hypothetical protein [Gemmatimonadota bacterium]